MIQSLEVRNWPYLGDVKINCLNADVERSCHFLDKDYVTTNLILMDEGFVLDGFDILALFLSGLAMNSSNIIKSYFSSKPTYLYLNYLHDACTYQYRAVITKDGFIKETLHEQLEGKFEKIDVREHANKLCSGMPLTYDMFFNDIIYYNYMVLDGESSVHQLKRDMESGHLNAYFEMIDYGNENFDNYMLNLIDLMRRLGYKDLKDIVATPDGFQIYQNDTIEGDYLMLYEESENFVNTFFISVCMLHSLFHGKIIMLTSIDRYNDRLAKKVYDIFINSEINTLGSQLFMSCYSTLLDRINFDEGQISRPKNYKDQNESSNT